MKYIIPFFELRRKIIDDVQDPMAMAALPLFLHPNCFSVGRFQVQERSTSAASALSVLWINGTQNEILSERARNGFLGVQSTAVRNYISRKRESYEKSFPIQMQLHPILGTAIAQNFLWTNQLPQPHMTLGHP